MSTNNNNTNGVIDIPPAGEIPDEWPLVDPEREEIVFGEQIDWESNFDGIAIFSQLGLFGGSIDTEIVEVLLEKGYMHPRGRKNRSPPMEALLGHGLLYESLFDVEVRFDGYIISPQRPDSRIIMNAIIVRGNLTEQLLEDFKDRFESADELRANDREVGAWWD